MKKGSEVPIAICVSGQPRDILKNVDNFLTNLVKPNNADVFMHLWMTPASENDLKKAIDIIRPKAVLLEKPIPFTNYNFEVLPLHERRPTILSMHCSIKKSNDLRQTFETENSITYSWVIRHRTDSFYLEPLCIPAALDNNFLYLPDDLTTDWGGLNDQAGFGSSDIMNHYASIFDLIIPEIFDDYQTNGGKKVEALGAVGLWSEKLLAYCARKYSIKVKRYNICYGLTDPTRTVYNFIGEEQEKKRRQLEHASMNLLLAAQAGQIQSKIYVWDAYLAPRGGIPGSADSFHDYLITTFGLGDGITISLPLLQSSGASPVTVVRTMERVNSPLDTNNMHIVLRSIASSYQGSQTVEEVICFGVDDQGITKLLTKMEN